MAGSVQRAKAKLVDAIGNDLSLCLRILDGIDAGWFSEAPAATTEGDNLIPQSANKFALVSTDVLRPALQGMELSHPISQADLKKFTKYDLLHMACFFLNVDENCAVPSRAITTFNALVKARCAEAGRKAVNVNVVDAARGKKQSTTRRSACTCCRAGVTKKSATPRSTAPTSRSPSTSPRPCSCQTRP